MKDYYVLLETRTPKPPRNEATPGTMILILILSILSGVIIGNIFGR